MTLLPQRVPTTARAKSPNREEQNRNITDRQIRSRGHESRCQCGSDPDLLVSPPRPHPLLCRLDVAISHGRTRSVLHNIRAHPPRWSAMALWLLVFWARAFRNDVCVNKAETMSV